MQSWEKSMKESRNVEKCRVPSSQGRPQMSIKNCLSFCLFQISPFYLFIPSFFELELSTIVIVAHHRRSKDVLNNFSVDSMLKYCVISKIFPSQVPNEDLPMWYFNITCTVSVKLWANCVTTINQSVDQAFSF